MKDIDQAIELKATAFHGAGHAVSACILGVDFDYATIEPEEGITGHIRYSPLTQSFVDEISCSGLSFENVLLAEAWIMSTMAGGIAQEAIRKPFDYELAGDNNCIVELAFRILQKSDISGCVEWLQLRTRILLDDPVCWDSITMVANELLDHRRISSSRIKECINEIKERAEENARVWE